MGTTIRFEHKGVNYNIQYSADRITEGGKEITRHYFTYKDKTVMDIALRKATEKLKEVIDSDA